MSEAENSWRIPEWFPQLHPELHNVLRVYFDMLVQTNRRVDLVSPRTIPFADLLHFADSINCSRMVMEQSAVGSIHDFGSGAGFPGLVLGLLYPEVQVYLVERNEKKTSFLKSVKEELRAKNISIITDSVENLPENSVEVAIARGFGPIAKTLLSTRKLFPVGGRLFHVKGEEWATEVSHIPSQLCVYWKPSHLGSYQLPMGEVTFSVVKTEKVR